MEPYRYYCDLINEIELLEYQLNLCINERQEWGFNGRLGNTVRMDQAAERMDKLSAQIERLTFQLDQKKSYQKHIEHKLSEFKSIEYKVAYGRIVDGLTLEQIAEQLGYSVDWIKRVSAKISKTVHF